MHARRQTIVYHLLGSGGGALTFIMAAGVLELGDRHLFGLLLALACGALIGARLHLFGMVSGLLSAFACAYTLLYPADSYSSLLALWPVTIGVLAELGRLLISKPSTSAAGQTAPQDEAPHEGAASGRHFLPQHIAMPNAWTPLQVFALAILLLAFLSTIASMPSLWGYAVILTAMITPMIIFAARKSPGRRGE